MRLIYTVTFLCIIGVSWGSLSAEEETIKPDKIVVYKDVGSPELKLHVFTPADQDLSAKVPVVVFFFGGGWTGGTPKQFYQQARDFTKLGMVAISAEYRIEKTHGTTPFECVKDGKSAIRWVRKHSDEWGIDASKVIAAGGSAGGHVAACTGVIEGHEEEGEDLTVSSLPNAMMLYNPVMDTTEKGYGLRKVGKARKTEISPCHHVQKGIPPTLIFHGTADKTVPFENVERFTALMKEAGNNCVIIPFKGKGHGFFNGSFFRPKKGDADYDITMARSIEFLSELGYDLGK